MERDYIEESKSIANDLGGLGLPEWQNKISDVISIGTSGTEIAMAIRFNLKELLKITPNLDQSVRRRARSTISLLDELLK